MRTILAASLAALAMMAASSAQANSLTKTVMAGGTVILFEYILVNPDCTLAGFPTLRISGSPSHGSVYTRKASAFPFFPPNNPRSECIRKRFPSLNVMYKPEPGYVGSDYVTVEVFSPQGISRDDQFTINVK